MARVAALAAEGIRRAYHSYRPGRRSQEDVLDLRDLLREENIGERVVDALSDELIESDPTDLKEGEDPFFGPEVGYEHCQWERGGQTGLWDRLTVSLRTRERFFNVEARELMQQLFGTTKGPLPHGLEVLDFAAGQRMIHRVRRSGSYDEAREFTTAPMLRLGAPREQRRSNRMNPHGTRVFYGAFSRKTALAEVRPLVGEYAVIGRFRSVRSLRLLNLPACGHSHAVSCFDADFELLTERIAFYAELDSTLSRPVLPNDEPLEYIASQAVAEYVRYVLGLDGIVYSSSQNRQPFRGMNSVDSQVGEANVVLFEPVQPESRVKGPDPFESIIEYEGCDVHVVNGVEFSTIAARDEE